jgi:hypothetical protein
MKRSIPSFQMPMTSSKHRKMILWNSYAQSPVPDGVYALVPVDIFVYVLGHLPPTPSHLSPPHQT